MLEIKNLWAKVDRWILRNVNLKIERGINVLLGPNGSGKTTLLRVIMGDPRYKVKGKILFNRKNITKLKPYERYKLGISIMVQNPPKIPIKFKEFLKLIGGKDKFDICPKIKELLDRNLFEGFSGGEIKRAEFLIAISGNPKLLLLDEPDSGVDVDSVKIIGKIINRISKDICVLLVTHSGRILNEIEKIEKVFVIKEGRIVKEGDISLAKEILGRGYEWI